MENENLEYKLIWKEDFLKVLCGLANTAGGILFIGIDDTGKVVGIKGKIAWFLEELPNKIKNNLGIIPSVDVIKKNGQKIIKIKVKASSVPISYHGKYYLRSGSNTFEMKESQLFGFLLHKAGKTWDELLADGYKPADFDKGTVTAFKVYAKDRLPHIEKDRQNLILKKLNLLDGNQCRRAAVLLFGKNPERLFPQSQVKVGKFASESELLASDVITGNLFAQLENALKLLTTKYLLKTISYEGVHRRDKLEYPEAALREALLNALVHRDYSTTSAIQIRIFPDRLVFMNEGGLPSGLSVADLKRPHISKPRNILLADVFYKAGFIESWGRGTIKIIEESKKYGLPEPRFINRNNLFMVIFYKKKKVGERVGERVGEKLTQNQQRIIAAIKREPLISAAKLSARIGISTRKIEKNLEILKHRNIIRRVGPDRGGFWEVL
jgi:ATP-dependent DNA helicase RecG